MDSNQNSQNASRSQDPHKADSQPNRTAQGHFQSMINNPVAHYQQQRNQQSPGSFAQNQMVQQQPHNGGSGQSKGVTFQMNRKPGEQNIYSKPNRDSSYDIMAKNANDQQHVDFYPNESGTQDDYSDDGDEANVTGSIQMGQRTAMQNLEDYAFSPRDGQANVRHRILQPNFKKRTPSGAAKIQQAQAAMQQQAEYERKKLERVKTSDMGISMSPPNFRQNRHDINAEDFVVEDEEAEAEMSSINQNVKKPASTSQNALKESQSYPKMFQGNSKLNQKKMNQINQNRGDLLQQEIGDEKATSPFINNYNNYNEHAQQYEEESLPSRGDYYPDNYTRQYLNVGDQRQESYGPEHGQPIRPTKLSASKHCERSNQGGRRATNNQNKYMSQMHANAKDNGKFHLNLHGVQQEKNNKLRKILSMRDPVSMNQDHEQERIQEEDDPENVMDNNMAQDDLDTANKLEIERNRLESVKQQRAVHSPQDKFGRQNHGVAQVVSGDYPARTKYTLRSSWKSQNKSKSNTGASGSQSARGPHTQIRGLSQSKLPISFQNQTSNNQQNQQVGWQPENTSASRKTFNQTQKLNLKGSSSSNLAVKNHAWAKQPIDDNSDNAEYNFIDQIEQDDQYNHDTPSPGKVDNQGLMEMPKTNQLMSQRNRISNISGKVNFGQAHQVENELMTPSTLMPQLMRISPSKRKNTNNSNNQVVMMMHHGQGTIGGATGGDDRMRRKGRGQQEQGNPKQTSEKYNVYNNPIQQVQASQVYMADGVDASEQDEDLGQEFSSPYSQYPNQQQMPRKSSVRLSNPDEEKQEIKNQNMHNMFPSNMHDASSKFQHYNRLPSKSAQLSFGKKLNFQKRPVRMDRRKNAKMPYSIFDQFKHNNPQSINNEYATNQKSTLITPTDYSNEKSSDLACPSVKQFLFTDKRIDKLYDEIYNDESSPFFAFFSSSDKNKKDVRKLESYYATNVSQMTAAGQEARMSPNHMSDSEFNSNFNSIRDTQNQLKDDYLQRKKNQSQKVKKPTVKDQQAQNDPMAVLWQELQDQDEELIFSDNCKIHSDFSNVQKTGMTSMSSLYVSGIESSRVNIQDSGMKLKDNAFNPIQGMKPQVIHYDCHAEVHNDANEFAVNVSCDEKIVYYFVCYQKMQYMREFMKAKNKFQRSIEDWTKYSLKNSIIPAIQGHVMILIEVPLHFKEDVLSTALSPRSVHTNYYKSCDKVANWLQTSEIGPLEQHTDIDPMTQIKDVQVGACLSSAVSTKEFYDLKLYQVDEELPDSVNPMFNPINSMYYVDRMGNLLKTIKQAFYEKPEDKSYLSKMFSSDNQSTARENLCKSYDVIREVYESILQPSRQKQLKYVTRLYLQDVKDAKIIGNRIKDGFSVEDLNNVSYFNMDMHADKSPTGLTFFDWHAHSILEISFFAMTTHQYMKVLLGLPEYDKNLGDNTQVLLKAKIDLLKKSLQKSSGDQEVQLVQYIQYLKSVKYNCNVFGKFNPIAINEEEIIEQMAKRR